MSWLKHRILRLLLAGLFIAEPAALRAETECVALFDRLDQIEMLGGQMQDEEGLSNAQSMYDHLGCANLPADPACRNLSAQIRSMQAAGAGNSDMAKERKRLMAELRRLGCMNNDGRGAWDNATEGARNPEIFDDLYREGGNQDVWRSNPGNNNYNEDGTDIMPAQSGRFRTLCVRTCDGFFWPISFQARANGFVRDQQMCAASCPNQEVTLFVHRNPGQTSEQSQSLNGEPYAALANAFLYKKRYVEQCSCQAPPQEIKILSGPEASEPSQKQSEAPPQKPAEESIMEKLKPHKPAQQDRDAADVYKSVPVIIAPGPSGQKSTDPNGLRGAFP